jgi:hypothetical protein
VRRLLLAVALLVLLAPLAACQATSPPAAVVNGEPIEVSSVDADVTTLAHSQAADCFEEALSQGQTPPVGGASAGAINTDFAAYDLQRRILDVILGQALTARHLVVSQAMEGVGAGLMTSQANGTSDVCGAGAQQVFQALPASYRNLIAGETARQLTLQAALDHVDLSPAAQQAYFAANAAQFQQWCVKMLVFQSPSDAQAAYGRLQSGSSTFASEASGPTVEQGFQGQAVCLLAPDFQAQFGPTISQVLATSPLGAKIAPQSFVDPSSGSSLSVVAEVDQRSPVPLSSVLPDVLYGLLVQANAASGLGNGPTNAVVARAQVTLDPRFGRWNARGASVVPPVLPPTSAVLNAQANLPISLRQGVSSGTITGAG